MSTRKSISVHVTLPADMADKLEPLIDGITVTSLGRALVVLAHRELERQERENATPSPAARRG